MTTVYIMMIEGLQPAKIVFSYFIGAQNSVCMQFETFHPQGPNTFKCKTKHLVSKHCIDYNAEASRILPLTTIPFDV